MIQTTIFDMLYPKFKIDKPIRLIEMFAGYGSQALALKYLGVQFEQWKICEWAVKSIQAYKDIHFGNDNTDYSKDYSLEDIIGQLYHYGISANYNEPMSLEQIKRLPEKQQRNIFNNIKATHNFVNIMTTHAEDLQIVDTDKYCYIMTYSFPCQDLSLAGKGAGMSDTSTRSGLLWEVERILDECNGNLPQILLMENVPQVHGEGATEDFKKWQLKLENLGYKNYWQDLIATDYGIPQTRNRCFMVSILGDYSYSFPPKQELKLKLKDMLEENVDEKYYIDDNVLQHIIKTKKEHPEYTQYDRYNGDFEQLCRVWKEKSPTLHTKSNEIKVYDNFCLASTQKHSGFNTKGLCQTLTVAMGTSGGNIPMHNYTNDLRIRKLTPKECFRLMGVKDEDYEKVAKNQSNASLYHLAGDSIVVNVLIAIFKELL